MRFVDTEHLVRSFMPGRISHFDLQIWSASIVTAATHLYFCGSHGPYGSIARCLKLDFAHVGYKVVVMILVGCVLAIARSTGTPITAKVNQLLIPYKHT